MYTVLLIVVVCIPENFKLYLFCVQPENDISALSGSESGCRAASNKSTTPAASNCAFESDSGDSRCGVEPDSDVSWPDCTD